MHQICLCDDIKSADRIGLNWNPSLTICSMAWWLMCWTVPLK